MRRRRHALVHGGFAVVAMSVAACAASSGPATGSPSTSVPTSASTSATGGRSADGRRASAAAGQSAPQSTAAALFLTHHGVGPLPWKTAGTSTERTLVALLGQPGKVSDGGFCALGGGDPGRLRVLRWGAL